MWFLLLLFHLLLISDAVEGSADNAKNRSLKSFVMRANSYSTKPQRNLAAAGAVSDLAIIYDCLCYRQKGLSSVSASNPSKRNGAALFGSTSSIYYSADYCPSH